MATEAEEGTRPSLPRSEKEDHDGLGNDDVDAVVGDAPYSSQSADGGTGESAAPEEDEIISRDASSPAGDGAPATEEEEDETPRAHHGAFVTLKKAKEDVRSNAGLWSTPERRQPGGGTSMSVCPPNDPSSSFSAVNSATSSFTTRKRAGDGNGNRGATNDYSKNNNIRNDNDDGDYAMTVTPDKQKRRPPKKRKEGIGAGVNGIWGQKKNQGLGLVGRTTSRVMTIGAAANKMMKTIQDEEWRKRWRGIHLPPVGADFNGESGRQKAEDAYAVQLAPLSGDGRDGRAADVNASLPSADIPRSFPPKPASVPRDPDRRVDAAGATPRGVPDDLTRKKPDPDRRVDAAGATARGVPDDLTRKEPVPSPWFPAYPDQPSVPLYPLLVCVLLHWFFKNYLLRRVFTYKNRTVLMRSVKEKLSELRYGGSSRQFRLTQEELEAHMRKFKTRNSFKSKRDVSGGDDGRSMQDREDRGGNEGDMGGGGTGSGGGSAGNMDNGGDVGEPSNRKSDGENINNKGVNRDMSGGKTSHDARLDDLLRNLSFTS